VWSRGVRRSIERGGGLGCEGRNVGTGNERKR
jgi:hypothetical protein